MLSKQMSHFEVPFIQDYLDCTFSAVTCWFLQSWSHLGPRCSSRWILQAELTGSGRIRTVMVSKVTSAWYSFTRGWNGGFRMRGGSV